MDTGFHALPLLYGRGGEGCASKYWLAYRLVCSTICWSSSSVRNSSRKSAGRSLSSVAAVLWGPGVAVKGNLFGCQPASCQSSSWPLLDARPVNDHKIYIFLLLWCGETLFYSFFFSPSLCQQEWELCLMHDLYIIEIYNYHKYIYIYFAVLWCGKYFFFASLLRSASRSGHSAPITGCTICK